MEFSDILSFSLSLFRKGRARVIFFERIWMDFRIFLFFKDRFLFSVCGRASLLHSDLWSHSPFLSLHQERSLSFPDEFGGWQKRDDSFFVFFLCFFV